MALVVQQFDFENNRKDTKVYSTSVMPAQKKLDISRCPPTTLLCKLAPRRPQPVPPQRVCVTIPTSFFSELQIILMVRLLCVPDTIRTDCGYIVSGRTAFCILLYRMAFPCRYVDMRMLFHLPDSLLCEAFNYMLHFMNDTWGPLLTLDVGRLVPQLEAFAEALQAWGCPLPLCWAFIDGTVRGICR